jgi:molecular chaperone DnaJ
LKQLDIFIISVIIIGSLQTTYAQTDKTDMLLEVSDEEKIILFASFAIAIIAIFLFLSRDIILRKKTSYDNEEFESKKERTYEKYHSDWGDDYEEIGTRKNTKEDTEFRNAARNNELRNYYEDLGVPKDATQKEIKKNSESLQRRPIQIKLKKILKKQWQN